ncbi:DUF6384 family protein [Rhizobium sp. MHM7A]|uniref:DUF6384 family protein n=1 Tax=Rhizobium sp. MHM7A TaxID=2583233 RepID=UPI00110651BF|nr:DUF6384 family protein [Rhizobium sp. MHM7A]TLX15884.1 hypothetical protein FFR93_00795 [Rhizobium sp. MHM7A]
MTALASAHSPSFNDLIVASDIVDTIRNDERLIDHELGSEDRKKALKARLKDMYKAQGMEVSDAVIEEAVQRKDAERFIFKPMKAGVSRFLWTSYVRRNKYALRLSVAVGVVVLGVVGYNAAQYQFVEKPALEAARHLELQLAEVLPNRLKAVSEDALASATRLQDEVSKSEIAAQQTIVNSAIRARDAFAAENGIKAIDELGRTLKETEARRTRLASAKQIIDAEAAKVAGLSVDANAREALNLKLHSISLAAESADASSLKSAIRNYTTTLNYVQSTYDIRIVDREGERSGVWRYWEPTGEKYYYLVVEAVDRTGRVQSVDVKNVENGRTYNASTWAIRVPQRTYEKVGADKQADGVVDNTKAGVKPAGSIDIRWDLPTINDQRITSW